MDPLLGDHLAEGADSSSCEYTLESGLPIKIVGEEPGGLGMQRSGSSMEQWAGVIPPIQEQVAVASEAEASLRRLQAGPTSPTTDRRNRNGHRRNFTPSGLQTQVISERGESDTSDMAAPSNLPAGMSLQDPVNSPSNGSSGFGTNPNIRTPHVGTPQITITAHTEITAENHSSFSAQGDGAMGEYSYSDSVRLRESVVLSSGAFSPSRDSGISPDLRRSPGTCKPSPVSERRHQSSGLGMGCSRSTSRLLSDTAHAALFGCSLEDNHLPMKHSVSMPSNFEKHASSEPLLPPAQIRSKTSKVGGIGIKNESKYKEHLNLLEILHKKATQEERDAREEYVSTTYEFRCAEASFVEAERKLKLQKTKMEGSLKVLYTCCENVDIISSALSQWRLKR